MTLLQQWTSQNTNLTPRWSINSSSLGKCPVSPLTYLPDLKCSPPLHTLYAWGTWELPLFLEHSKNTTCSFLKNHWVFIHKVAFLTPSFYSLLRKHLLNLDYGARPPPPMWNLLPAFSKAPPHYNPRAFFMDPFTACIYIPDSLTSSLFSNV